MMLNQRRMCKKCKLQKPWENLYNKKTLTVYDKKELAHTFEKARLIGLELRRKQNSKSFSINKRNINSTQYF